MVWLIPCLAARLGVDQCVAWAEPSRPSRLRPLDHVVSNRASRPATGGVDEAVETADGEAVPPLAQRHRITADLGSDLGVGGSTGRVGRLDLGSQRQGLGRRMPARPALERGAFPDTQGDLDSEPSSLGSSVPLMLAYNTGSARLKRENSFSQGLLAPNTHGH
jgi:hypothetical protein